jgi:hypothetical protein
VFALGNCLSLRGWKAFSVELAALPEVWSSSSLSEMRSITSIGAMVWLRFAAHVAQGMAFRKLVVHSCGVWGMCPIGGEQLLYVEEVLVK